MTVVVKIGGSSLSTPEKIRKVARSITSIVKEGKNVVTVVSALGKTTDELLSLANGVDECINSEDLDSIVSMGERISARLFCSALKTEGVKSSFIDVDHENWPIITDEMHGNANVLITETKNFVKGNIEKMLKDNSVVVVPGFIGRSKNGRITTLGRGGSDTTAFVIADSIGAEQVVLVSDNQIKSGDPKIIRNSRDISEIHLEELLRLADSGKKFMHKKSLMHKPDNINVRIVSNQSENFLEGGTMVKGSIKNLSVEGSLGDVVMITISGKNLVQSTKLLTRLLDFIEKQDMSLLGVNTDSDSFIFYVESVNKKQINKIHDMSVEFEDVLGIAVRNNLHLLRIKGVGLETTEGVLAKITDALKKDGLNVFGVFTITDSILLFLDGMSASRVKALLERTLEVKKNE